MRVLVVAAVVSLVLLLPTPLPTAEACSGTYGPSRDVHVVVTDGGRTLLDQPTGRTYATHPCGSSPLGRPQFDGRYVAWHDNAGTLHAVDVESQEAIAGVPNGHLWNGAVHASEGIAVATFDLATGTVARVEAPTGTRFQGTANGVAWAVSTQSSPPSPREGFHLLDLEGGAWLMQGAQPDRWPEGDLGSIRVANEGWVVVSTYDAGRESLWAVRVDAPQAPVRLPLGEPSPSGTGLPVGDDDLVSVDGLVGDRLYLTGWSGGNGGPSTYRTWSYLLPGATEPGGGLGNPTVGARTASFRVADTPAPSPTSFTTTPAEPSETLTTRSEASGQATSAGTASAAAAGIAGLVAALGVLVAVRRRLQ